MGGPSRKQGRAAPKGGSARGRMTAREQAELDKVLDRLLRSAGQDLRDESEPLAAQVWASHLWSIWHGSELIGQDAEAVFAGGLIRRAAQRPSEDSMVAMRALASVAPEPYRTQAQRTADRLASEGVHEPIWSRAIGQTAATGAWLSYDPVHDDGVSVMVGFDGPAGADTIGLYIDHNMGGLVKDAFCLPTPVDEVVELIRAGAPVEGVEYRAVDLTEAAMRWQEALAITDMTVDPPIDDDVHHLRALVLARLELLPSSDGATVDDLERDEDHRQDLLDNFMVSDEAAPLWAGDGDGDEQQAMVAFLASQIISFSLDYVLGTPLRFSPVMAEIFCLDWAPRKIAADEEAFELLPEVLAAWVRFAGHRRGIPDQAIEEATSAVDAHAPEMIDLCEDPDTWGPAKTMVLAMQERGIDISDPEALDSFVAEVNDAGGVDVLADSLAGARVRSR